MGTSTEVTVWCDSCGAWEQFNYAEAQGLKSVARKQARKMGWVRRAGGDLCPHCSVPGGSGVSHNPTKDK